MRKPYFGALLATILCVATLISAAWEGTAAAAHTELTWQGSQTCLTCHDAEALEMHASSHYQWQGPAPYAVNGADIQGKMNTAFNSYCVSVLGNWNACGSCHAGLGAKPEPNPTTAQLENIDCLICHQKDYKRKKVNGVFIPDTANMTITMDQAVQTVHLPERLNCLQCHAKGGGGDNNKRGDIAMAHATTTDRNFDVHMSSTGADLTCQQCHTTQNHRIAGRGSDLRQTDLDIAMSCSTAACHPTKATATGHTTADVNRHIGRVACQTCHISTYARNAADTAAGESTEVYRDWTIPEWNAALGRYEPTIPRGSNLKPAYRFWGGYSRNYSVDEPAWVDPVTGAYATSRPVGAINALISKLYPFKYKKSLQPLASNGVLVALDTAVYFSTGNYDSAVKAGLRNMGYASTQPYENVETDTYQLITHEVMPKASALTCTQCHTATATQMNLKDMGYTIKGTQDATCAQCHESKSMPFYTNLHNKHVTSKAYDCSWCHTFSRPEKGLSVPPGPEITPPAVTAFGLSSTSNALTVSISTLQAIDDVAVTAYLVSESSAKPLATAPGWSLTKPATYIFASEGAKILYAWAKDAAGNVSGPMSRTMTILNTSLFANFAGFGLYKWDGSAWSQLTPGDPENMVVSGSLSYGDFGGSGIWKWDGSAWSQLTPGDPESIAASGLILYGDFGASGLWKWDGSAWSQLTAGNPENMVASGSILYGDFGASGLWKWDGSAWSQLTPGDPENMVVSGSLLYGDFGANGLYKWDGSAWSQLTPGDPESMVVSGSLLYGEIGRAHV